jgi:hypothetical protein
MAATAIDSRNLLRSYWITFHDKRTFPQIGVTGRSIVEAFTILHSEGHRASPDDTPAVVENVRLQDLDPNHVVPNTGPIVCRGIWCPFAGIGQSAGARDR